MKKQRVEISLLAQKDLHSFERFANYAPDATRFTDRMLQRVRSLEFFPQQGICVEGKPDIYRIVFGRFKIFYHYREGSDFVKILRFWRAEREEDPI